MGIGPGSWVGLMLGNVPDFVILALALSKIDAVVVPLDPTTGNRELEMVLEAAPLRALITRPRGGEGGQATAGPALLRRPSRSPPAVRAGAAVEVRAREPPAPAGHAADLQPLQAQPPSPTLTSSGRGRVVQFTATVGGDPKGVVQDDGEPRAAGDGDRHDAGHQAATDRVLCTLPLHHSYGFDFGLLANARARHDAVPRGRDLAEAHRQAAARAEHRLVPRDAGAVRLAGARADGQAAQASPARATSARARRCRRHRRELPAAVRHPPALLLPQHAGRPAGDRSHRQGPGDRRAGRSKASSCASPAPKGEKLAGGETGPIWVRSRALSMLVGAEDPPAQARRRRRRSAASTEGWLRTGDLGQHRQLGPPDHHRARGRPGQGRRQARRARRGRGLPRGVPQGQGGAGARSSPTISAARWSSRASCAPASAAPRTSSTTARATSRRTRSRARSSSAKAPSSGV